MYTVHVNELYERKNAEKVDKDIFQITCHTDISVSSYKKHDSSFYHLYHYLNQFTNYELQRTLKCYVILSSFFPRVQPHHVTNNTDHIRPLLIYIILELLSDK